MVRVEFYRRRSDGALDGFEASGHTGFAESGSDIVCAAVSALTTVTVLGLQARLELTPDVDIDDESGLLRCRLPRERVPADRSVRAQDLLETLLLGLQQVAEQYETFVEIEEVAV